MLKWAIILAVIALIAGALGFTGDVMVSGQPLKDWGLHLIDVNLEMGDLNALVARQAKAYAERQDLSHGVQAPH